ncbi:MAG: hypothetical protein ACC655_05630 [Rhodothermia bacterium]
MAEMLRLHLVDERRGIVRNWALSNLYRFTWFVNFTEYEDLFRECDARYESLCSQFFVMNKLVFGNRQWKREFLRRALTQPTNSMGNPIGPVSYDGFSVELRPADAMRLAIDHGMAEMREDLGKAHTRISRISKHFAKISADDLFDVPFGLLGTETGDRHPALVLAERLAKMDSEVIVRRVLDDDRGFQEVISRYQSRLRAVVPTAESPGGAPFKIIEDDEVLPELMIPLGNAYRWFVENPPVDLVASEVDFSRLDEKLRFYLRGGCDGVRLKEWVFDSDADEVRARLKGKQSLQEHLGRPRQGFEGPSALDPNR